MSAEALWGEVGKSKALMAGAILNLKPLLGELRMHPKVTSLLQNQIRIEPLDDFLRGHGWGEFNMVVDGEIPPDRIVFVPNTNMFGTAPGVQQVLFLSKEAEDEEHRRAKQVAAEAIEKHKQRLREQAEQRDLEEIESLRRALEAEQAGE